MHILYSILFFIVGIGLIPLGIWLSIKEMETLSKWHNDKWTIGQIRGMGVGCVMIGVLLIVQAFS